jgi:hypothetical protein
MAFQCLLHLSLGSQRWYLLHLKVSLCNPLLPLACIAVSMHVQACRYGNWGPPFTPPPPMTPAWQKCLAVIASVHQRCNALHLSAMGRGLCMTSTTYGTSATFNPAEYDGLPSSAIPSLERTLAGVLDGCHPGQPPALQAELLHGPAVLTCNPSSHILLHVMPNWSVVLSTPLSLCCAQRPPTILL